tara:strand:- start:26 stop:163 length:138 start_codon:yes stop_codon:yes gene_type:complete
MFGGWALKKKMNGQWQETRGHACGPKNCVVGGSSVLEGGDGGGGV